ncbi:MAG: hypothetical protein RSC25_07360 [Christensenella sp.]
MEKTASKGKKIGIITGAIVATVLIIFAAMFVLSPAHLITMDVNPSISIETNRLGRVVSVNGINDDAKAILANYNAKGKVLENVVSELADLLIVNGYLQNGTEDVLVTVRGDSEATANMDKMNSAIAGYMEQKGIKANISSRIENFTAEDIAKAEQQQMSVGKMLLLEHLSGGDPAVFTQLTNMNITELNKAASKKGVDLDELDGKSLDSPLTQKDIDEIFEDSANEALENEADIAKDAADAKEEEAEVAADAAKEQSDVDADTAATAADEQAEKTAAEADAAKDAEDKQKEQVKADAEAAKDAEDERKAEEEAKAEEEREAAEAAEAEAAEAAEAEETEEPAPMDDEG